MAVKHKPIELMIWMVGGVVIVGVLMALISVTGSQYVRTQATLADELDQYIEDWAQSCLDGADDCEDLASSNFDQCNPADHPSEGFCAGVLDYDQRTCEVLTAQCFDEIDEFLDDLDLSDEEEDDNFVDNSPTPEPTV